jgi:hypothetical protein
MDGSSPAMTNRPWKSERNNPSNSYRYESRQRLADTQKPDSASPMTSPAFLHSPDRRHPSRRLLRSAHKEEKNSCRKLARNKLKSLDYDERESKEI